MMAARAAGEDGGRSAAANCRRHGGNAPLVAADVDALACIHAACTAPPLAVRRWGAVREKPAAPAATMLHARSATLPWCVPARRRLRGAGACAVQAARRIVAAPAGATERPRQPPQARTPVEARRTVLCADAMQWLAQQHELPCVVTSLPDVTELSGPPLNLTSADAYSTWFRQTVALITSKLRRDSVAVFYQTSTQFGGQFIDKSFLCSAGASGAQASKAQPRTHN